MAKATRKKAPKQEKLAAYRITAKQNGLRRAGIVHVGTREYAAAELNEVQLAAIEAEPLLILERLEVEEASQEAVSGGTPRAGSVRQEAVSA